MFELIDHPVKIKSVNARAEHHGDEMKAMYDVKVFTVCDNRELIHFHHELRAMLFKRDDNPALFQDQRDGDLTALKFPQIDSLKWNQEFAGYTTHFVWGIDTNIEIEDCKLKKFVITPSEGGTVFLEFTVVAHIRPVWVGKICELIKQEIMLTVEQPQDKQGKLVA